MLFLILYENRPGSELENRDVKVSVYGLPVAAIPIVGIDAIAQVKVTHSRRHPVHRQVPGLGESMGQPLLVDSGIGKRVEFSEEVVYTHLSERRFLL
jgi:hypothetical protein